MTCIVGIAHKGSVWIGADSAGIEPSSLLVSSRADEKVFITDSGEFIMGFSGCFRTGQLLRYSLSIPEHSKNDDMSFMVNEFIDSLRMTLKDKGAISKDGEREAQSAPFIVGYRGNLYVIESDFQVGKPVDNYVSVGSGAEIALGALYATRDKNMPPKKRIMIALQAAFEYNAGIRPPYHVLTL